MARIVLGLGTSHSPQLSTGPEFWAGQGTVDETRPLLAPPNGTPTTFAQLAAERNGSLAAQLTPQVWQARHDACQRGIERVGAALAEAAPDVLVIMGDDQQELFRDDNMPAIAVYWGDSLPSIPRDMRTAPPGLRAGFWAYGEEERSFPVAAALGQHLIRSLVADGFDLTHSRRLPAIQESTTPRLDGYAGGMGHAYSFIYRRIMNGAVIPTVPVMVNTHYPPNQPTPKRCFALGQALRRAVEAWDDGSRVAIIASGGLSHFVIDEELDRSVLQALQVHDSAALTSIPESRLSSGSSEIRNWIAAAGAFEELQMELFDYVPCYRSLAGTGCAMAFARWTPKGSRA